MSYCIKREDSVRPRSMTWGGVAGLFLFLVAPAQADLTDVAFTINATSSSGTATHLILRDDLLWNPSQDSWSWTAPNSIDLIDTNTLFTVATLSELSMTYIADPQVTFGFSVQAGALDTTFSISSGLLSFPTINSAEGLASGGLTVTDTNGDGATLIGLNAGGSAYTAHYNGQVPAGATFADLFTSNVVAGINDTNSVNDSFPGGGLFASIGVPVNDISAQFAFSLTAGDIATGSSNFTVVPTPGGLAVLAIGLLGTRKRRRRK